MNKLNYLFLIEDDLEDVLLFRDAALYVDPNIKIAHAATCPAAVDALKNSLVLPDLIILDYNLPGTNGKECLQQLKSIANIKDIPVIFFSTTDCPTTKSDMIKLGAFDFFTKPMRFSELIRFVNNLVKGEVTGLRHQL